MIKKLLLIAGVAVLAMAAPAAAGGWATSTLDQTPTQLATGTDQPIGFTVLQHGRTPVDPTEGGTQAVGIRMVDITNGTTLTFPAQQSGPTGHYVSTVRIPTAGTWQWEVLQGWFQPQPLGEITVTGAAATAGAAASTSSGGGTEWWRIAAFAVAGVLVLLVVVQLVAGRRKDRRPTAVAPGA
jgi:hypothetical protein